jgi:integrase
VSLFLRGAVFWTQFYKDGIRYQESTGATSRRQAELIEKKLREEVELRQHGIVRADPFITFGEVAARFIANGAAKPFHLGRLEQIAPYFGKVPVRKITKGMTNEYRKWRVGNKIVSDATLNRDLACIRRILFWALDENLISFNPLARLKLVTERPFKARVLGVLDEEKLLEASALHLRRMILIALYTGMRRGEILNQRWEHVDLEGGVLYVSRSKTMGGEGREVPLGTVAKEVLIAIRKDSGHVFEFHGTPIGTFKTAWLHAVKKSLPYHLRFHDLRHTANSRMMEAGVVQDIRKAILGHSSGREINTRYTHVESPAKREAIRKLEAWVEQQKIEMRAKRQKQGGTNECSENCGQATEPIRNLSPKDVGEEITRGHRAGTEGQTEEEGGRSQGGAQ